MNTGWLMLGAPAHTERRQRLARVTIGEIERFVRRLVIIRADAQKTITDTDLMSVIQEVKLTVAT